MNYTLYIDLVLRTMLRKYKTGNRDGDVKKEEDAIILKRLWLRSAMTESMLSSGADATHSTSGRPRGGHFHQGNVVDNVFWFIKVLQEIRSKIRFLKDLSGDSTLSEVDDRLCFLLVEMTTFSTEISANDVKISLNHNGGNNWNLYAFLGKKKSGDMGQNMGIGMANPVGIVIVLF